jgi:hypothetical protein
VDLSFGLLRDEAGAVTGAMAVGRDGTARYLADGALRARIAEQLRPLGAPSQTSRSGQS